MVILLALECGFGDFLGMVSVIWVVVIWEMLSRTQLSRWRALPMKSGPSDPHVLQLAPQSSAELAAWDSFSDSYRPGPVIAAT